MSAQESITRNEETIWQKSYHKVRLTPCWRQMDKDGLLLLELLVVNLHQRQHVAVPQRVGKLVVALLLWS